MDVNQNSMDDPLAEKIVKLKEQITKLNLNPVSMEDDYLTKFLRARSESIPLTIELLKNYINYKESHSNMFNLPVKLKIIFDFNVMKVLDHKSLFSESVIVFKPGNWNPSKFNFDSLMSATLLSLEWAALNQETQMKGLIMISDMSDFGWKQLKHFSPFQAKKMADLLERIVPIKVNGIHIFNQSRLSDVAWTIVKPFLSELVRNKITFHGTKYSDLEPIIETKVLHNQIGGESGPLECQDFYLKLVKDEAILKPLGYS